MAKELTKEELSQGDDIHKALLKNNINNDVANFLVDLAMRVVKLEKNNE